MVVRVAERVRLAATIDQIWVATDDRRIWEVVREAGFEAVMTASTCSSGTDRVARALELRPNVTPQWVINVQGDEPLIDPAALDRLVRAASDRPEAIHTLARPSAHSSEVDDANHVKVAMTAAGRALYFSRAPIPHGGDFRIHIGVYAFTPPLLRRFVNRAPTALESVVRLEQLRALELDIPIYITMCWDGRPTIGVDEPADIARVEAMLRASSDAVPPEPHWIPGTT